MKHLSVITNEGISIELVSASQQLYSSMTSWYHYIWPNYYVQTVILFGT